MAPSDVQEALRGRSVVASISGGRDSAAMSLWLMEQGIQHQRVFFDTGWESSVTYDYLRGPLTEKLGEIVELSAPRSMESLIRHKGIFPSRRVRYCTEELKLRPLQQHLAALMDSGLEVVSAVGIRAAESSARSQMSSWEWSPQLDCDVWRPLLHWTVQDVVDIHKRHGLRPNPLYLNGAERVGCWPCVMSRKAEIRLVADTDPERIAQIRELERELTERLRARCAESGELQRWSELTFFQGANSQSRTAGQTWPIGKVVGWSRTSRGGVQLEVFAAPPDAGCMRWGLCEGGATHAG